MFLTLVWSLLNAVVSDEIVLKGKKNGKKNK